MFTKRTIKPHQAVAVVDTASEALAVSISEKACVDMDYMSQLTGKTKEELAGELQGVIFRVPGQLEKDGTPHYVTADEYLSGNVRRKLRQAQRAAQQDPVYAVNVEALTAAQPKDLDASEIEVRLGATWIDKEYIQQFMYETFNTPFYLQRSIEVNYSSFTAEWQIKGKSSVSYNDVAAYTTYGTSRANAYKILEDSLNLRDVRIYDTIEDADGKERRVLNAKETTLAAQKQQAIREAFRDWIWRDPERRQTLVRQYNEEMNSTRPREYDGSHITFGGMNPAITLREHQKSAIAHVLYGGNTLLAHEVGAGKTFEMVAAAMEAKRLGLCQKSLFVVPNHLTEQWASEFLRLYPSANILVTTKKDFETHNRKKFCARIATGDYDAIIMGHSQFERIPISRERQERLLYEQIDEITEGIAEVQASGGERFTVKQLERTRKSLEARLEKLQAEGRKDDVVTFEQLGVDRLFVDEAHNYKNLFLYTKMRNVAGLSTSDAQKSSDMFAKRCKDEKLRGTVKEVVNQISHSKKWKSDIPMTDEKGNPLLRKNGKPMFRASYSILQDELFHYMTEQGFKGFQRGEYGSTAEHLTSLQYQIQQDKERLEKLQKRIQKEQVKYEPARHISKTLNEIDSMGQKTFTGKMAISQKDYSELTALAKEGITSRAEIKKFEQSANFYRQKYMDSANALERMKTKYNELKEKCRPFLEALEHFPEVAKLFTEKVKQLFSFKEAQERAEKEAREKERQERIKARKSKRGMER